MKIKDINKFPFLTFPQVTFVEKALRHLTLIGALQSEENSLIKYKLLENDLNKLNKDNIIYNDDTEITNVGHLMIKFPIPPKYSRIIILGHKVIVII